MLLVTGLCKSKGFEGVRSRGSKWVIIKRTMTECVGRAIIYLSQFCLYQVQGSVIFRLWSDFNTIKAAASNSRVNSTTMKSSTFIDKSSCYPLKFLSEKVSVHSD